MSLAQAVMKVHIELGKQGAGRKGQKNIFRVLIAIKYVIYL